MALCLVWLRHMSKGIVLCKVDEDQMKNIKSRDLKATPMGSAT